MAQKYFKSLNYSMANEDTTLERSIALKLGSSRLLCVCGSGSRSLPLLNEKVESLDCVDLSSQQLSLAKMRLALIKQCSHQDYLKFWGYPPFSPKDNKAFRKELLDSLPLDCADADFFTELHKNNDWESLLYKGKWESSFATFGKIVQTLLGPKALEFFQFNDLAAQKDWLNSDFPWRRWNLLVKIIGNRATFNALLYKGDFIKKNVERSYFDYYSEAFQRLFTTDLAKNNFFLQLCMLGAIRFPEGNLLEARPDCHQDMKKQAERASITFNEQDIISFAVEKGGYDFISISDVPSYFSGDLEKNFLQKLRDSLNPEGVIVMRSYLRVPEADRGGYKDISGRFKEEIAKEKTQMYQIEVLQKL